MARAKRGARRTARATAADKANGPARGSVRAADTWADTRYAGDKNERKDLMDDADIACCLV
jgi:hypothetical protein